ncbi:hypothetical protein SCATT_p04800 (plasmid) [Streptantibioticus cattleyicolor NRRL 8057 = DSM 46488]|uniref:Uncharacterized protein n=1 Tax=Streptantibioticus cattleyicolor (strain ATCC 35852 / DSM 46488 / JCM 4925 / NBRC 14057 / NRRL 8057) TaxID=1003195 RepID=F8JMQ5_STREN|nr:hypothetical protein SCATT_p04800 [Streptantibioticus cattleyicolor NRRL 8057 = DSM 46488]CCB72269.1 protein of unknown function [Streptantibioticus cattleyicolor NRRL 8057 = DSM 46488]
MRLVDALPEPDMAAPRAVGVDEYATRVGRGGSGDRAGAGRDEPGRQVPWGSRVGATP